jgi:diketogulonate reductase-like aldo/keto reductase
VLGKRIIQWCADSFWFDRIGTWQSPPGEVKKAVSHAVRNGYKLVDCAYCYANEEEVGQGLKEAFDAGVKREDIFVTSKVWATYTTRVEEGLNKSLKALGLDYVDLFMIVSASTGSMSAGGMRFGY